jgi:L-asparagine transporter-like permease
MSATKIIAIVVLLVVGAHLLLYGFLKRKIDAAKREEGIEP